MAWPSWLSLLWLLWVLTFNTTAFAPLSDETLSSLPDAGDDFDIYNGDILAPILIPRVPGTPGSAKVRQHFVDWFQTHLPKWTIEFQNSTSKTPVTGNDDVPFINIVLTRDPPWKKPGDVGRLALVAHYDSKLTPTGFIGGVDSAAPCAMIMHAARSVDESLTRKWDAMEREYSASKHSTARDTERGLQILFLDGEEAFLQWTDTDSTYGARALAEDWEASPHLALSTYRTKISSIELFLLLDLLGSQNPSIPSYYPTTHWAYQSLANIESRLRASGQAQSNPMHPFLPEAEKTSFYTSPMLDDHIPFLARGVEVLHIIPHPFPAIWHTIDDDGEHLDMATVEDWAKMVTAFVGEWMDLEGHFPSKKEAEARIDRHKVNRRDELNEL